ncbi:MAG: gephyrin-like molybdotransferase Glp [Alphaproteobacteria bacterium]
MRAADALALLAERVSCVVGTETAPLSQAHGRILAATVTSGRNVPGFDNAAVDGYAFAFSDLATEGETRLRVTDRSAAGDPAEQPLRPGTAVRIFTGAMMPSGADTAIMEEDVRREGAWVVIPPGVKCGANRRKAGEDIRKGATVLERGLRLRPQDIGVAASVGRASLEVYRPLRVALFSTGNELSEPGQSLPPGGVYDSNRYMLEAMLRGLGCAVSDLGILADTESAVRGAIGRAAVDHHVVITSGGASRGEEDHVITALRALGRIHFWQLAIKPGRPLAFGQIGRTVFLGLPGNPVAAALCLLRFARPVLLVLAGGKWAEPVTYRVPADFDFRKKPNRREWLRAKLVIGEDGTRRVRKFPREGSGILTSLSEADGLIELPEELTAFSRGDLVDFLPFSELGIQS